MAQLRALPHRGLLYVTDDVAFGIAREQALTDRDLLRGSAVETDLGTAVLLREIERLLTRGGAS